MRWKTFVLSALIAVSACAVRNGAAPREYLDETTAATITVVARPWVFVEAPTATSGGARDFLNVYAIDVNRSGEHRQYLAVLQWWPHDAAENALVPRKLAVKLGDRTVALGSATQESRKLGIAQTLETRAPASSQWLYFPVNKDLLQELAMSQVSGLTLVSREYKTDYTTWKEARAEVAAFTSALR